MKSYCQYCSRLMRDPARQCICNGSTDHKRMWKQPVFRTTKFAIIKQPVLKTRQYWQDDYDNDWI